MLPYLVLLRVGFAVPRDVVLARGALLPHRFTLTTHPEGPFGGLLSVALSVGSRRPGVTWHLALWSPDFPRSTCAPRDCLADSAATVTWQCRPLPLPEFLTMTPRNAIAAVFMFLVRIATGAGDATGV